MTQITGKTAVVTGGGNGIGMGLAKELAHQGAAVVIADIQLEKAQKVADDITASGGRAIAVHCDVCDRASIRALKQAANDAFGPVGLLFANAGATSFTELKDMSDDDVDWIVQVNLMGVMNTIRAFLPDMVAAREGHLVATSSLAGLLPGWLPAHVPYSASKAGIIGMMLNLQLELRPFNIATTTYCPGGVASGMKNNNGAYRPARFGGPEPVAEVRFADSAGGHSSQKFYLPEAVAPMVLRAVRNDRPFVFDHSDHRRHFRETYSSVVEACFDDVDAWERDEGIPEANPHGAALAD